MGQKLSTSSELLLDAIEKNDKDEVKKRLKLLDPIDALRFYDALSLSLYIYLKSYSFPPITNIML